MKNPHARFALAYHDWLMRNRTEPPTSGEFGIDGIHAEEIAREMQADFERRALQKVINREHLNITSQKPKDQ